MTMKFAILEALLVAAAIIVVVEVERRSAPVEDAVINAAPQVTEKRQGAEAFSVSVRDASSAVAAPMAHPLGCDHALVAQRGAGEKWRVRCYKPGESHDK